MTHTQRTARRTYAEEDNERSEWIAAQVPLHVGWLTMDDLELSWPGTVSTGSAYADTFWMPILGPSSVALARKLQELMDVAGHPSAVVELGDLASEIGLGHSSGLHSPVVRTLSRMIGWRWAAIVDDRYAVRTQVPMLTPRQVERLPLRLQVLHGKMYG